MAPGAAVRWNINKYETIDQKHRVRTDREATRIVDREGRCFLRFFRRGTRRLAIRQRFVDQLRLIAHKT